MLGSTLSFSWLDCLSHSHGYYFGIFLGHTSHEVVAFCGGIRGMFFLLLMRGTSLLEDALLIEPKADGSGEWARV